MPPPLRSGALAFCLLLAGFVTAAQAADAPPSVETFFRKPQYGDPVLSPNGRYVAVTVPMGGRLGLGVIDLDTRTSAPVASSADGDVLRVAWQNDNRLVVVVGDLHGATGEPPQEHGIVAINRDGSNVRVVAGGGYQPIAGRSTSSRSFTRPWTVSLLAVLPGTRSILVTARERTIESLDLYRYDTESGEKTLLSFDSPGDVTRWVVDGEGVPRAVVASDVRHDVSAWYVRRTAKDGWTRVETAKLGRLTSTPLRFDADGRLLYVAARRDGDRAAIYEYDLETGAWRGPVVRHPERDIDASSAAFIADPRERKLLGLRYADDRPAVVWFDREFAAMQKSVDAALPDTFNMIQGHADRWLVVASSDRNPGAAYLLDGRTMKMEKLLSFRPWIDPGAMATTTWVRYRARDGLAIPALLTVPAGVKAPVPLVVVIHGGPIVPATAWGFDAEVQFLASRGYAVLQPQFRGTAGFGARHQVAGYRRWGEEMQDDLEDGVLWAVAEGIAERDRVCFYGGSYGGYAALWGAIRNAGILKCAVAFAAVSSIDLLFDSAQSDLASFADASTLMSEQIGDPRTERSRFKRVSPLDNAERAGVPILLAYGAADVRVPLAHGTLFRDALERNHKANQWVVYNSEGHGFNRDENVFDFYRRVERFLAKYLAPKPEPGR